MKKVVMILMFVFVGMGFCGDMPNSFSRDVEQEQPEKAYTFSEKILDSIIADDNRFSRAQRVYQLKIEQDEQKRQAEIVGLKQTISNLEDKIILLKQEITNLEIQIKGCKRQ